MSAQLCQGQAWSGYHFIDCRNRGKIERDGNYYCGRHDPVAVKARDEKHAAEMAVREAYWARVAEESAERERRLAVFDDLVGALAAILPFIPTTTVSDGGAATHSAHVRAADMVRAALAKAVQS